MIKKVIAVLVCTALYAIIRYVIFGGVSPIHMPAYVLNKSVSTASVSFLFFAALSHAKGRVEKVIFWGTASLHFAYIHVLFSLALLSSAYYPKLFDAEKMNLTGEFTVLFGVLAAYCFWLARTGKSVLMRLRIPQVLSSLFVAGHLVAMGFGGWLKVGKWYGGLPPISLISFVFTAISLALFLKGRDGSNC